jgi:hypothetical protein
MNNTPGLPFAEAAPYYRFRAKFTLAVVAAGNVELP